jgi:hypothetical protein
MSISPAYLWITAGRPWRFLLPRLQGAISPINTSQHSKLTGAGGWGMEEMNQPIESLNLNSEVQLRAAGKV